MFYIILFDFTLNTCVIIQIIICNFCNFAHAYKFKSRLIKRKTLSIILEDLNLKKKIHHGVPTEVKQDLQSLQPWDTGLIPGQAQWVKDPALPELRLRSQLRLRSDPAVTCGVATKENK